MTSNAPPQGPRRSTVPLTALLSSVKKFRSESLAQDESEGFDGHLELLKASCVEAGLPSGAEKALCELFLTAHDLTVKQARQKSMSRSPDSHSNASLNDSGSGSGEPGSTPCPFAQSGSSSAQQIDIEMFLRVTGNGGDGVELGKGSISGSNRSRSTLSHEEQLEQAGIPFTIPPEVFDKLGGWHVLTACVSKYYSKLANDPMFRDIFANVDRSVYERKLSVFIGHTIVGKLPYDARTLWLRHRHLIQKHSVGADHVDRMLSHLVAALDDVGAPEDVQRDARNLYMEYRWVFEPNVSFREDDVVVPGILSATSSGSSRRDTTDDGS